MIIYDNSVSHIGSKIDGAVEYNLLAKLTQCNYMSTHIKMPFGTPTLIEKHIEMGARLVDNSHWLDAIASLHGVGIINSLRLFDAMTEHGADDTYITALIWLTDNNPDIAKWMGIDDELRLALTAREPEDDFGL